MGTKEMILPAQIDIENKIKDKESSYMSKIAKLMDGKWRLSLLIWCFKRFVSLILISEIVTKCIKKAFDDENLHEKPLLFIFS